jgi:hypothetical protein
MKRPCLSCGVLITATASRCEPCAAVEARRREANRRRVRAPHRRGDYDKRAAFVRANATMCWLCGGGAALYDPWSADHVRAGDPTSPLAPAHRSCNSSRKQTPPTDEQLTRLAHVVTA